MQENIDDVIIVLSKNTDKLVQDYGIKLIYIFGSYAKGKNKADSDLDIAVYFNRQVDGFVKLRTVK